ncbi:MAG: BadM/Rrf2 family transcriptional regulator [Ignavibacteria bacterium]|nr:MAG: BadM/Rrf2 family transcriptional regulator [Ignavibacteria bacterium]KAF0160093.1 MAG: BadM/Rrf2 family transcriptional regulator [Ignavibacteria bacterium]
MKFSATEEYGLRCLLRIAKFYEVEKAFTIPEISKAEGLSEHNAGKILRSLRLNGFLESSRGQIGGYALTRPPEQIFVGDVLNTLGGKLFDDEFCSTHAGVFDICTNSIDCSVRSLWKKIQSSVDSVVSKLTLRDLMGNERVFNGVNNEIIPFSKT